MARTLKALVVVLVLAIFAGACAQKSVRAEVPAQPEPGVVLTPEQQLEQEELAHQQQLKEDDERDSKKTLAGKLLEDRESRRERNKRLDDLKERELEGMVFNPSERESEIRQRAEETDLKKAREKAQKAIERVDTPAMREARRERDREERERAKYERETREMNERASVLGCGPETAVLTPDVEQRRGALGRSASVTLVNASDIPWNIRTESRMLGHVVKDVCVGGSLGLHFTQSFWQQWRNWSPIRVGNSRRNMTERIVLVATAAPILNEAGEVVRVPRPQRFTIRINTRTNQVSTVGVFQLNGKYLPRERASRVTRSPRVPKVPEQTQPVQPSVPNRDRPIPVKRLAQG